MPKDQSNLPSGSHKSKNHSYKPYSKRGKAISTPQSDCFEGGDLLAAKDWEQAVCPICMDVPHNALLLLCSSHDKGCHPYMCDTSYRHSNCFDQYRKANGNPGKPNGDADSENLHSETRAFSGRVTRVSRRLASLPPASMDLEEASEGSQRRLLNEHHDVGDAESGGGVTKLPTKQDVLNLMCPLCRGKVEGWKVVDAARCHLNAKTRSCAHESCPFMGTYEELRAHARSDHPSARPSEVDPARQMDWCRLEQQRDLGDVLSTIRSAMPGASILGDYAIDDNDAAADDDEYEQDNDFPGDDGHWWTVFLLFQVFGPAASSVSRGRTMPPPSSAPSSRLRGVSRSRHRSATIRHQRLWGEGLQLTGGDEGHSSTASSDTGEPIVRRSRRRRRS